MKSNDQEISRLFNEAEHCERCLRPASRRVVQSLKRRMRTGGVISPLNGLFARAAYWRGLTPTQQALHLIRSVHGEHPNWVFCRESAALLHGLPVSYAQALPIRVSTGRHNRTGVRRGIAHHALDLSDALDVDAMRATSLEHTLCDVIETAAFP